MQTSACLRVTCSRERSSRSSSRTYPGSPWTTSSTLTCPYFCAWSICYTRPKFYTSVQPGGRSVEDGKRDILGELAAKFLHFYPGHKLDDLWDMDIRNITALLAQALLLRGERMVDEASVMRLASKSWPAKSA